MSLDKFDTKPDTIPDIKHELARRFMALPAAARQSFLQALAQKGVDFSRLPIVAATTDASQPLSLSFAQQRVWFQEQLEPGNAAYHIPAMLRLDGRLDLDALQASLDALIARHAALRTSFHAAGDGQVTQRIHASAQIGLAQVDLSGLDPAAQQAEVARWADLETRQPFDLSQAPLMRARLLRLGDTAYRLLLVQHHIISDGWSVDLLLREFAVCYRAFCVGALPALPPLAIQYSDYALWQRHWLEAGERARQLAWWREALGDEHPLLAVPTDRPRPATRSLQGARHVFALDAALSEQLRALARRQGVSLFMLMLAAYQLMLSRLCGQREVSVGVSIAGRARPETQELVGFFVNTQVLRAQVAGTQRFDAFLAQVKTAVLGAQAHQDLPFDLLVDALQVERSLAHNPLVQVKLTQQIALPKVIELPGLRAEPLPLPDHAARFDLSLDFTDTPDGIEAVFSYATALFEGARVAGFAHAYQHLLTGIVAAPQARLVDLGLPVAPADFMRRGEALALPVGGVLEGVLDAWARNVAAHPHAAALQHEDQRISFAELDAASNRLARHLQARGVGAEQRVAVCASRSPALVLGLLAALKAGAACLPLDPMLPAERMAMLLRDAGVHSVLADAQGMVVAQSASSAEASVIALDADAAWSACDAAALGQRPHPDAAAYVIYTSGSTGQPKGVVVSHGALADYVAGMLARFQLAPGESMAMVSTVAADLGHTVLFGALCSGRLLHLISAERAFDPDGFAAYMAAHQVGVLKIVPSHLQGLLQAARPADVLPRHALILGGETLPWSLLDRLRQLRPDCRVFNHYGPTETTVGVLTQDAALAERDASASVPVGLPLPNAEAYVLDADLLPVAQGSVGDLYLGGPGLARGYLGQPGLSAERFVPHPFARGQRLYRSGDRVRSLSNGALEFLGRGDDQVKIRGYRVELSEVAAALRGLPGVGAAEVLAVALHGDASHRQLLAYVVPVTGTALDTAPGMAGLKAALARQLPDYMLPTHWLALAQMPLTANGKLDHKALPLPQVQSTGTAASAAQVETSATERTLIDIWKAVLRLDQVGVDDNFFALGGDSILSLQIIARARRQGLKLSPKQLFENQTVAALARVAQPLEAKPVVPTAPSPSAQGLPLQPLTPVQTRFFALDIGNRHHWNQALRFVVGERLDADGLGRALAAVCLQHEALRCRYLQAAGGRWCAQVLPEPATDGLLWQREVADETAFAQVCDQAQRSLNIETGSLLRAVLGQGPHGAQWLFIAIHHLAVDGVSWRVLLEDLEAAYRQVRTGKDKGKSEALRLAAPGTACPAWAALLATHATGEAMAAELPYWLALADYRGAEPPRDVSTNDMVLTGGGQVRDAAQAVVQLDRDSTERLLKQAPAAYRTQINDLLLAALARVLGRWMGGAEVLVELEGHGREALFDTVDLSRSVGWFSSHFPVRLAVHEDAAAAICGVKESLRGVPHKGIGFGLLQSLATAEVRAQVAALPKPRITFNYLGQFDAKASEGAWLRPVFGQSGAERDASGPLSNWLAIHGQVADGVLSLTWVYSRAMYQPQTVDALAQAYRDELLGLITHCCAPLAGGVTPSDFPLAALQPAELRKLAVPAAEIQDVYPATALQQGFLFHSLLAPEEGAYVNQLTMDLTRPDVDRLAAAWQAAVDRHDILRTSFWHEGLARPQQLVHRHARLEIAQHDWRDRADQASVLGVLAELCVAERQRPFDLHRPPLMRLALVRLSDSQYRMVWTRHHLLLDGWSTARLWAEVLNHYAGQALERAPRARFRDYIAWLGAQDVEASRGFWQGRLAQLDEPVLLAGAMASPRHAASPGPRQYADWQAGWSAGDTVRLQAFARAQRITLNSLVQGAWALLLQRYTGRQSVVFGATVAGRPAELAGVEQVLGLFINTLPVVLTPPDGQACGDWLRGVQAENLALREHEHTPLFEIQAWAGQGGQALFDSLIVFENYPVGREWTERDAAALQFGEVVNTESTSYPLTLVVTQTERLDITYGFDQAFFAPHEVRRLHQHLAGLLDAMLQDAQRPVGQLALPTAAEQAQLAQWNHTEVAYADALPVHRAFEYQAQRQPDAVALLFGDTRMSYQELDQRANQLAHRLITSGVQADDRVAVCLERSLDLVVSLLAVLKAGAAYVPLDPDYPVERRLYMLQDARPALLLTHSALQGSLAPIDAMVLCVDQQDLSAESVARPAREAHSEQLAYLIYTSGSTGRPKGAGNSHAALQNRLQWMQQAYGLDAADTVLQKTPFSFDVSVWEFFWPLMVGARLAIAEPGAHRDPARLAALIAQHRVTTLHFVPSMLQAFMSHDAAAGCTSLRHIVASGEALPAELAARVGRYLPQAGLHNLYGPTEAAIDVTHWTCRNDGGSTVPIGAPIANTQIHVLDAALNPLPPGVAGELYIGGVGLARGYHARPALTAERFLPDPFRAGGRLYRTGDLACWRDDGVLEYLGRLDHQVKLRGLRIELGEIEARLLEHPAVREAVVVAHDGDKLIGYLVPHHEAPQATLLEYLAVHLPAFMLPAQLIALAHMPLTPNGKLDRKALPAPTWQGHGHGADDAPVGDTEQHLAALWRDLLGVDAVGRSDNFFALGGHSLLATQVVARLKSELQVSVPLRRLFENASLAGFAQAVDTARDGSLSDDRLDTLDALFDAMEAA